MECSFQHHHRCSVRHIPDSNHLGLADEAQDSFLPDRRVESGLCVSSDLDLATDVDVVANDI